MTSIEGTSHPREMPKNGLLSDYEKGLIVALSQQPVPVRTIATTIGPSPAGMQKFLKRHGTQRRVSHPKKGTKVSPSQLRHLFREASKGEESATGVKGEFRYGRVQHGHVVVQRTEGGKSTVALTPGTRLVACGCSPW